MNTGASGVFSVDGISYKGCTVADGTGAVVYMECEDASTAISSERWPGMFPSYNKSIDDSFWVKESITTRKAFDTRIVYFLLAPSSGSTEAAVYVAGVETTEQDGEEVKTPQGVEIDSCGWRELPCLLINTAMSHRGSISRVSLYGNTHNAETTETIFPSESEISVDTVEAPIVPKALSSLTSPTERTAVFRLQGTSASFRSIAFSVSEGTNSALFSAESGTVTLTYISVTSSDKITLASSIILLNGATSTIVTECTFTNIKVDGSGSAISGSFTGSQSLSINEHTQFISCESGGNGGAVCVDLGDSGTLTFRGGALDAYKVAFTNCESSEGLGGGVYATCTSDAAVVTMQRVAFSGCGCAEDYGKNVYIVCPDGSKMFTIARWSGTLSGYSRAAAPLYYTKTSYRGEDDYELSILFFLYPQSSTDGYVSANGIDDPTCGRTADPCKTITQLRMNQESTVNVKMVGGEAVHTEEQSSVIFDSANTFTIGSTDDKVRVKKNVKTVGESSSLFVMSGSVISTSFSTIDFQLARGVDTISGSVFSVSTGELSLTSITLSNLACS